MRFFKLEKTEYPINMKYLLEVLDLYLVSFSSNDIQDNEQSFQDRERDVLAI